MSSSAKYTQLVHALQHAFTSTDTLVRAHRFAMLAKELVFIAQDAGDELAREADGMKVATGRAPSSGKRKAVALATRVRTDLARARGALESLDRGTFAARD